MAKAGNDARIEFILTHLRKGGQRKDILQLFAKNYKTSTKTFDNLLKKAKERIEDENKAKESQRQANIGEELKAEIQAEIASEIEIDLVLSKFIMGGATVEEFIKGEAVIRGISPMEVIAAADKLYKRRGSYAPVKQAQTDSKGNDVPDINKLAPDDLNSLLAIKKNLTGG